MLFRSQIQYDQNLVSDLHKEAYGFRPSEAFWLRWKQASEATRQEIWDDLLVQLERELENAIEWIMAAEGCETINELKAQEEFEMCVSSCIATGAKSRENAIEWIMAAEGCETINELEWKLGLKYGYIYQTKESNELTPQESQWLEAIDNGDTHAD